MDGFGRQATWVDRRRVSPDCVHQSLGEGGSSSWSEGKPVLYVVRLLSQASKRRYLSGLYRMTCGVDSLLIKPDALRPPASTCPQHWCPKSPWRTKGPLAKSNVTSNPAPERPSPTSGCGSAIVTHWCEGGLDHRLIWNVLKHDLPPIAEILEAHQKSDSASDAGT